MVIPDGYDGHWIPIVKNDVGEVPGGQWPMKLDRKPILMLKSFSEDGIWYRQWSCKECDWVGEKEREYVRPMHNCRKEGV